MTTAEEKVLHALEAVKVNDGCILVPEGLNHDTFVKVNTQLEAHGGTWDRDIHGHRFKGQDDSKLRMLVDLLVTTARNPPSLWEWEIPDYGRIGADNAIWGRSTDAEKRFHMNVGDVEYMTFRARTAQATTRVTRVR